jgi:hypothetical protein
MGQGQGQKQEIVTLPACTPDGVAVNGSHRVVLGQVVAVSPEGPAAERATVSIAGVEPLWVAVSAAEVSRLLGWEG